MNKLNIHKRLKQARSFLKLNQTDVATALNIQQKSISDIENGKIHNIPNSYIYYFYNKGISLEWIYNNTGAMTYSKDAPKSKETNTESKKSEEKKNKELVNTNKKQSDKSIYTESSNKDVPNQDFNDKDLPIYERIIDSKDDTIKKMHDFINLQENHIDFLKDLVNKLLP